MENFESIKQLDENGSAFWSIRQLGNLIDYRDWSRIKLKVNQTKETLISLGIDTCSHLMQIDRLTKNNKTLICDYLMTDLACFYFISTMDIKKPKIMDAQVYFAEHRRSYPYKTLRDDRMADEQLTTSDQQ